LLGFERYLYWFAYFKIKTLKTDTNENDFFTFLKKLPEEGIVLDIGANLGVMTYYLSKKIKKGKIIAFEPLEINFNVLKKIIHYFKLGNVEVKEVALGENSGELEMILPVIDHVKMHGLSHVKNKNFNEFTQGITYTVSVKKLDNFYHDLNSSGVVTGIKLDAENYEYQILKGGLQLLTTDKPMIYCELWDNQNRRDCIEFMLSIGYGTFVNIQGELVPFDVQIHRTQNFFFIYIERKEYKV